jgi:hypothetical protein
MRSDEVRMVLVAMLLFAVVFGLCTLTAQADSDSLPIVPEPTAVVVPGGTVPPMPPPEFAPPVPTLIPTPSPERFKGKFVFLPEVRNGDLP